MKKTYIPFIFLFTVMIASSVIAELQPIELRFGRLIINPNIYVSAQYDDNIYLSNENTKNDLIYRIRPGIELLYGAKTDDHIFIEFQYEWESYDKYNELDDDNWYLDGGLMWTLPKSELSMKTSYSTDTSGDIEQGDLTRETKLDFDSEFERHISSKTSASALFKITYRDYPNNHSLIDYTDWNPVLRFYYKMFAKSDIYGQIGYGYVNRTKTDSSDSQYTSYSIGIRRDQTSKLQLEGRIGAQYRTNEDEDLHDKWHFVFYLKSLAKFSRLSHLTLHGGQYIAPAANNLTADKSELWIETAYQKQISSTELVFNISGKYRYISWDDLIEDSTYRKDNEWTFHVDSKYYFTDGFHLGLSYEFRTDDSNVEQYDFDENKVTFFGKYDF